MPVCLRRAVTACFSSRFSRFGERRSPPVPVLATERHRAPSCGVPHAGWFLKEDRWPQSSLQIKALRKDSRGQIQEWWVKWSTLGLFWTIYTLWPIQKLMSGSLQWQNWHRRKLEERLHGNSNLHLWCQFSPRALTHTPLFWPVTTKLLCRLLVFFKKKNTFGIHASTLTGCSGLVDQLCNQVRKLHKGNNLQSARAQLQKSVLYPLQWLVLPLPFSFSTWSDLHCF